MTEAVIVSTARTPIGKAFRGAFNMTHGATLGGHVVKHAVERAGIDPAEVEDVVLGCATPEKATGSNIARLSAIRAGMPVTVSGVTVNRFCSSGLQTIAMAAQRIIAGEADCIVAGGLESISPDAGRRTRRPGHRRLAARAQAGSLDADDRDRRHRGGALQGQSREAQDEYSLESQRRTATRPAGRALQGRDRAAAVEEEGGGQEHQGGEHRRGHAEERRGQPPGHQPRRPERA